MLHGCDGVVEVDSVRAETLLHGVEEEHLKFAAVDANLRDCVAGVNTTGFDDDRVAEAVVVVKRSGLDAGCGHGVEKTEISEDEHGGGLDVDSYAEGGERAARFENVDVVEAVGVKMESAAEATDAGAGDNDRGLWGGCRAHGGG